MIPVKKIKRANKSENVNKPAQKYMEIVTEDDCEFWFMGFLRRPFPLPTKLCRIYAEIPSSGKV